MTVFLVILITYLLFVLFMIGAAIEIGESPSGQKYKSKMHAIAWAFRLPFWILYMLFTRWIWQAIYVVVGGFIIALCTRNLFVKEEED